MGSNFCVPLVMNKMFSALLNFDVFNKARQHNCAATLAKAAIAAPYCIGVNVTWDRKFYRSTMAASVKSVFFHSQCFLETIRYHPKTLANYVKNASSILNE